MNENLRFQDVEALFEGRKRGNQLMASGIHLTPEEARLLWTSPRTREISWLDLDDNRLGDQGVKELADSDMVVNVQYLNLNSNGITDEGLKALARSTRLTQLKRLHLRHNPIRGEGILALFNSETLENLSLFQLHEGWTCRRREGWRYKPRD